MDNNKLLTPASPLHFLAGIVMANITKNRFLAYSIFTGFELLEQIIARNNPNTPFGVPEGPINITSDLILSFAGYEITRKNL